MTVGTFTDLAAEIWKRPARLGRVRLIVIDGPAGSGKTTFARRLARALNRAPVLHLDDLYEGWSGLDDVWGRLERWVLVPLATGYPARYRRYDWAAERFADWQLVPVVPAVVLEGCGAGQRAVDDYATVRIWVEAPEPLRLTRGLGRDGEQLRSRWLDWQKGEVAHFERENTRARADLRVNGAPTEAHDPEREFVTS